MLLDHLIIYRHLTKDADVEKCLSFIEDGNNPPTRPMIPNIKAKKSKPIFNFSFNNLIAQSPQSYHP